MRHSKGFIIAYATDVRASYEEVAAEDLNLLKRRAQQMSP
jgi:hypothetical protein